jgi:hypothetical protein
MRVSIIVFSIIVFAPRMNGPAASDSAPIPVNPSPHPLLASVMARVHQTAHMNRMRAGLPTAKLYAQTHTSERIYVFDEIS